MINVMAEYVSVFNCIMETVFIQCQPNITKWKKITAKSKQKPQQLWRDAAYSYVIVSSALQVCYCVEWLHCILYHTRKLSLQSWKHQNHYSTNNNTIQKSPSCFKINRKKSRITCWTLHKTVQTASVDVAAVLQTPASNMPETSPELI